MPTRLLLASIVVVLPTLASAQSNPELKIILNAVGSAYNKQEQPMVIFDVDGTIFDNRNRTLVILQEYARQELKSVRPKAAKLIQSLTLDQVSYQLPDTLKSAGVTEQAVINNAAVFWSERFFNDDYLVHDSPNPGVVNYIRTLYSTGARIVYLTGRDAPRQLLGTVKALRDNGLPIGIQGTELIMKPSAQTQDAVFKQQAMNYLRQYGKVVAAFDTEPANANVFKRAFPDAIIVAFGDSHSPNPPPLLSTIKKLSTFE